MKKQLNIFKSFTDSLIIRIPTYRTYEVFESANECEVYGEVDGFGVCITIAHLGDDQFSFIVTKSFPAHNYEETFTNWQEAIKAVRG